MAAAASAMELCTAALKTTPVKACDNTTASSKRMAAPTALALMMLLAMLLITVASVVDPEPAPASAAATMVAT